MAATPQHDEKCCMESGQSGPHPDCSGHYGWKADGRGGLTLDWAGTPGITDKQAVALHVLHGQLGRPLPELFQLTFDEAGDLIMELRADLLALTERAQ